jgi:hypothetical protein
MKHLSVTEEKLGLPMCILGIEYQIANQVTRQMCVPDT